MCYCFYFERVQARKRANERKYHQKQRRKKENVLKKQERIEKWAEKRKEEVVKVVEMKSARRSARKGAQEQRLINQEAKRRDFFDKKRKYFADKSARVAENLHRIQAQRKADIERKK